MLQQHRQRMLGNKHNPVMRKDSEDMSGAEGATGEDREGGAAGFNPGLRIERRHLQSVDSNHMESQSEWSDDELGRDGESKFIQHLNFIFIKIEIFSC